MSPNGTFDSTGFTDFDNSDPVHDNSSTVNSPFDAFDREGDISPNLHSRQYASSSMQVNDWYLYPSNIGGPSTGAEGASDGPARTPTTLYPTNRVSFEERYNSSFYRGVATPTFPLRPVAAESFPTHPSPDDLGPDSPITAGPSVLPAVHPSPPYREPRTQVLQPGPHGFTPFDKVSSDPITGVTSPVTPLPNPVASSSGPQRTRGGAKGSRKHNPVKSARKKDDNDEGEHEDGWDATLVQFQAKLDDLVRDRNGQRAGWLSLEKSLAVRMAKTIKEDLERSPLQDTKAGEGKRPRSVEDYLTYLLREIVPAAPTSNPGQGGSNENEMRETTLARVADALEAKLLAVNQHPTLCQPTNNPRAGRGVRLEQTEGRVKKNDRERSRRDREKHHLERMSYLFEAQPPKGTWARADILSFAVVFLLYDPSAFSPGFVKAISITEEAADGDQN